MELKANYSIFIYDQLKAKGFLIKTEKDLNIFKLKQIGLRLQFLNEFGKKYRLPRQPPYFKFNNLN